MHEGGPSGRDANGGAVSCRSGRLDLSEVTLSSNTADGDGGGVFFSDSDANFSSVTVANNVSNFDGVQGGAGGGLFARPGSGDTVTVKNSVFAGNLENNIGDHDDCDGTLLSGGNNLVQQSSGCVLIGGGGPDQFDLPAQLGALADRGGPAVGASNATVFAAMLTHLPLSSSPLINAGAAAGCKDDTGVLLSVDQRGLPRHVDGPDPDSTATCDIGATEFGASAPLPDPVFANGFE